MCKITIQAILIAFFIFSAINAHAVGVGFRAGTLGLGVEFTKPVDRRVTTRFGINQFKFKLEGTEGAIDYDFELNLGTVSALVDWHPGGGGFRVTGGIMINNTNIDINSTTQGQYDIGDDSYTGNVAIKGELNFLPVSPYFGVGWGSKPSKKTGWSFSAELGAVFQGNPSVNLSATGTAQRNNNGIDINVSRDALFLDNLSIEEGKLQNDIDNYNVYPVLALGFIYSF